MAVSTGLTRRAMFVFICFVWGTTWLAMKIGIETVPPGVFAGLRWTIAGAVLLTVLHFRGQLVRPPWSRIPRLVFVSVLLITLNQVIQLYGLKYISAGLAAVISSALTPIFLLGFAVAFGQERINRRQIGALALGVCGVSTLFGPSALHGTLNWSEAAGAAGVTIGCLCYCAGSVMTRPMMRNFGAVQLAGLTNLIGGLILLFASLLVEPGADQAVLMRWGWVAFVAWLYLLIPGALLATTMYFLLVRDWGASKPGMYAFISPVIAVVIGATSFGERLDPSDAIGMTLMLGAAGLALRRGEAKASPETGEPSR